MNVWIVLTPQAKTPGLLGVPQAVSSHCLHCLAPTRQEGDGHVAVTLHHQPTVRLARSEARSEAVTHARIARGSSGESPPQREQVGAVGRGALARHPLPAPAAGERRTAAPWVQAASCRRL